MVTKPSLFHDPFFFFWTLAILFLATEIYDKSKNEKYTKAIVSKFGRIVRYPWEKGRERPHDTLTMSGVSYFF